MKKLLMPVVAPATFLFLLFLPIIAFAQETVDTSVDIGPVVVSLGELVIAAISAAIVAIAGRLLKLRKDSAAYTAIQTAAEKGAMYAVMKLRESTQTNTWSRLQVQNELVRLGAQYAAQAVPSAIARSKFTPEKIKDMVEARLWPSAVDEAINAENTAPVVG